MESWEVKNSQAFCFYLYNTNERNIIKRLKGGAFPSRN